VNIRKAVLDDIEDLHLLYTKHLTQTPPIEVQDLNKWRELFVNINQNSGYHLIVASVDHQVVASITLIVIPNLTHNLRPYALIENVVTHVDYRNQGYASKLIAEAVEIAKENNCYKIMLMTGSKKEETLRFYENCGFTQGIKTGFLMTLE